GFVIDILDPRSSSFGWVLLTCVYSGLVAASYLLAFTRGPVYVILPIVGQFLGSYALAHFVPHGSALVDSGGPALKHRLTLVEVGIVVCIGAAWGWMVAVVNRQALELVLATVELTVAQRLQADLVPIVSLTTSTLNAAGRSAPSSEMGGDLVDVVEHGGEV